jgi:hypothetical protein
MEFLRLDILQYSDVLLWTCSAEDSSLALENSSKYASAVS